VTYLSLPLSSNYVKKIIAVTWESNVLVSFRFIRTCSTFWQFSC